MFCFCGYGIECCSSEICHFDGDDDMPVSGTTGSSEGEVPTSGVVDSREGEMPSSETIPGLDTNVSDEV